MYKMEVCQNGGILTGMPKCIPFIQLNLKIPLQQYLNRLMSSKAETYRAWGGRGRRYLLWEWVASNKEKVKALQVMEENH